MMHAANSKKKIWIFRNRKKRKEKRAFLDF